MSTGRDLQSIPFGLVVTDEEPWQRTMARRLPDDPVLLQFTLEIIKACMERELPCQFLGIMPLFDGHHVYQGSERDCGLMRLEEDPLYQSRDGYPMPTQVKERLASIQDAGIDFDAIYVAHEVEKGSLVEGRPIDPLAVIPPPAPSIRRRSKQLGSIAAKLFKVAAAPLLAWSAASLAVASAGAVAAVGAMAAPLLDPVIFGVVVRPGSRPGPGELGCWFHLAQWRYGEEER